MKIRDKEKIGAQVDGGGQISLTEIGSTSFGKKTTRQDFSCCQIFFNKLLHIQAIQGHTRKEMIEFEMLGRVLALHNWKEFVFC